MFIFLDKSFSCDSWPSSYAYGCKQGDGSVWIEVDKEEYCTNVCEYLCGQKASGKGCCYVNNEHGCYWMPNGHLVKNGKGLTVNCDIDNL